MSSGILFLGSMLFRRLGLLIIALGLVRWGLTVMQVMHMPYETVATIENAYAGRGGVRRAEAGSVQGIEFSPEGHVGRGNPRPSMRGNARGRTRFKGPYM